MFSTQVCALVLFRFIWTASESGNTEHIKYPKSDPSAVKPGTSSLVRKSSAGVSTQQEQQQRPPSSTSTNAARAVSPLQQAADPGELRRAVSPQNARIPRPTPNELISQPASVNGKPRRVPGGDDDAEVSTESAIRERTRSPEQTRALSPPARGGTPTVSIESLVKTGQHQRSESPLVERERTKSPDAQSYGQQQSSLSSVNGFSLVHGSKSGSTGDVSADLIRDLKTRDAELEALRRRQAWMKAALVQACHAGFVYVNASPGDEDRGIPDDQPKIAEAVITLKQLHGSIQVRAIIFLA
jgi:hypothetical protein